MKRIHWQYIFGGLLILLGVVFLLDNFDIIENVSSSYTSTSPKTSSGGPSYRALSC
jgi:hypothetical protein